MSENSETSNVSRRHFLAVAGSVAAASSFAVGKDGESTKASTVTAKHYVVTIDVTGDGVTGKQITYSAPGIPDARDLPVIQGDDIKWKVKSAPPNPKHRSAILFPITSPFAGTNSLQWGENDDAAVGYGPGAAQTVGQHYYCVAVYDKVKHKVYLDDPKIIVGSGNSAVTQLMEARKELAEVRGQIVSIEKELESAVDKLQRK
jgi:hypothetical protein